MAATSGGEDLESLVAGMDVNPDPVVQLGARAYWGVSDGERASYMTTMATRLRKFLQTPVKMVTDPMEADGGGFVLTSDKSRIWRGWTFEEDFRDQRPTAYFVRGGNPETTGAFVRLLITNAFETRKRMMLEGYVFTGASGHTSMKPRWWGIAKPLLR